MDYAIGAGLGLAIAAFAWAVGLDRDRAFYPTVLIVVGSYYALFAVMGGSRAALGWETLGFAAFAVLAVAGFKTSLWLVALGLAGHAAFDFLRGDLIVNPGMPAWWPAFCGSIDVVLAACLGWLLARRRIRTAAHPSGEAVQSRAA